ncbi:hypothetical protein ABZ502_17775 [Streptomyces abikoensis]|uniref:hypothetical protein n=1 Tax=Streptomyces abikoensis TaxID=97398 RepID=UPI0033CC7F8D
MNRSTIRAAAAAAIVLLAAGCSSTDDSGRQTDNGKDKKSPSMSTASGLEIRPGKDLVVYQQSAIAALDRETLQVRKQVTVPEEVSAGRLAGTDGRSRTFDSSFRYALLGQAGISGSDAEGVLKIADLTAAGTGKAVLSLTREALNAAGATGTISAAQFTASTKGPELWFQTTSVDAPAGENWSSATADQYKITALWSINVKDWQAGHKTAVKHDVPEDIQTYWKSQECQTAFSRSAGDEGLTPWSCWLLDASGTPVASGPAGVRAVQGTVDTGWTNPAKGTGTEKITFSFLKGNDGKPATPVNAGGAGGNAASTLNGLSGIIDSGSAAKGERKMWRFSTSGAELKLTELPKVLPPSTGETKLWAFPDGQAVAKVKEGDLSTGWILTSGGDWKKIGPWVADLEDAEIAPTA